jgi:5-methylcytosine-specific restriction protein A
MDLVTSVEQVEANLRMFASYVSSPIASEWYSERLRLGSKFVVGTVEGQLVFAPSRVAGYADCTMERHKFFPGKDGRVTNVALSRLLGEPLQDAGLEAQFVRACHAAGVEPADKHRRAFWTLGDDVGADPVARYSQDGFPSEMREFVEGASARVVVNAYERDAGARDACLDHHGHDCSVCGFDFFATYGDIGRGFIHVHHLTPISKRQGRYKIDPVEELRPVCPNCHAMLHKTDPPLTIQELQSLVVS